MGETVQASRKSILANGKAPFPKYTQAELAHIANAGVADEKYIVRLVEEPHINRDGYMNGTLVVSKGEGVESIEPDMSISGTVVFNLL